MLLVDVCIYKARKAFETYVCPHVHFYQNNGLFGEMNARWVERSSTTYTAVSYTCTESCPKERNFSIYKAFHWNFALWKLPRADNSYSTRKELVFEILGGFKHSGTLSKLPPRHTHNGRSVCVHGRINADYNSHCLLTSSNAFCRRGVSHNHRFRSNVHLQKYGTQQEHNMWHAYIQENSSGSADAYSSCF